MVSDFLGVPSVSLPVVVPDWQRSIVRDFWHTLHCVVVLVLSINDVATDFGDGASEEELVVNLWM